MESKVYIDPYPKTMKMLGLERINIDCGNNTSIVTPANIAKDMVALLPDEIFIPESKFLDICCKSGIFLTSISEKLMNSKAMIEAIPDYKERYDYITNNQLYGISPNGQCQMYSVKAVYGTLKVDRPHILCFGAFEQYKTACLSNNHKFLYEEIMKMSLEFKEDFHFDVVIGNPPYNKGMDLDFVDLAYKLSKQYVCMITPAKWQTAEANQRVASKMSYGEFRQKYVPHMSYVCFYPDAPDIFDIAQTDGITYFLLDYKIHKEVEVVNKCNRQSTFNSVAIREINCQQSLINIGNEIIKYINNNRISDFTFGDMSKQYKVYTASKVSKGASPHMFASDGKTQYLGISRIINSNTSNKPEQECSQSFSADTREECESFVSYINTRFVRFLLLCNVSKLNGIICDDCFRFVPAPPSGKFDHIYTDEELYKAFNLPQKYIDVIEAVIKERK